MSSTVPSCESEANSLSITFQSENGMPLAGTLVLPSMASKKPVPALLLIQGSGPTDRNGNQEPELKPDLLKQVAEILAEAGIASLRYDKRGMHANSPSFPKDADDLPLFCRWESFVNDATFAFKFLASRPKIDSDSVGIFGHSEGGSIALDVSQNQKFDAPAPKLLILAATAGRSLGDIISEQICAILSHQKAEPQAREFFLKENRRIQKAILATGKVPSDVPSGLRIFYPDYIGPFLKSALALDTPTLASSFSGPILVINGMADTQVSAERDAGLFAKILSNRSDGSEVYLPTDVSHNLKHINGNPQGFDGDLDGRVKDKVLSWLKDILQPLISR